MESSGSCKKRRNEVEHFGERDVAAYVDCLFSPPGADTTLMNLSSTAEAILRSVPFGLMVCNMHGTITFANMKAKQLAQSDPKGRNIKTGPGIWGELFDQNGHYVSTAQWPCVRALYGEVTTPTEYHLVHRDGRTFGVLFGASPIGNAQKHIGSITTLLDITQYRRVMLRTFEDAVSTERTRMATDLHDGVAQDLAAIMLQLQASECELPRNVKKAEGHLHLALGVARKSLQQTRRYLWTLSQEPLVKEDLIPALSFLTEQFFADTAVKVELRFPEQLPDLPSAARSELLKVGREALANVAKHANANNVRVELSYSEAEVRFSVSDDGKGFLSKSVPNASHGFGLFSMRARIERLGGKVLLESEPGHGTRITAIVPLA